MLAKNYEVYFGNNPVGKVQVIQQGLYYRIICRCHISGATVCKLYGGCGERKVDLGVVVPIGDGFGTETRIPVKRFGEGTLTFFLRPKQDDTDGVFAPIFPEEPFSYIARLKESFLEQRENQIGIRL